MPLEDDDQQQQDTGTADKGKPETVTLTKAEFDAMKRDRDEARTSEKYWSERARATAKDEKADDDEEDDQPGVDVSDLVPAVTGADGVDESIFADPEKWLDAISKGPKAIEALVKKQGYVDGKQAAAIAEKVARRVVDVERGKITTDNKLMTSFPELADKDSALFKATAEEFQALIDFDPSAKKNPATLFAAARTARARLKAEAPARRKADDGDEYGYDRAESDEDERRNRVRAQDGSRGGRPQRNQADEEERIGPQARQVLEGFGLSEDKFKASVKNIGNARRRA